MSKKPEPWEINGWIRGEQIPGGNQGHTFLARRRSEASDRFDCVLKTLKRNDDPTRRARFHIEAESLRTLNLPSVARLIDTNTQSFLDPTIGLFVVTERIEGPDLAQFATSPLDVKLACRILARILVTVENCHAVPVVHRDIKPVHVILRNGDVDDAVLIDFGLAFNEEVKLPSTATALEHGVGNRFIIMPEQLHGLNKRDLRSDLTQCVGLLFFLLTGRDPGIINDTSGHKPHERVTAGWEKNLTSNQLLLLRRLFDIGFEWDVNRRWQSAKSLREQLECIMNDRESPPGPDFNAGLDLLLQRVKGDPEFDLRMRTKQLIDYAANVLSDRQGQVATKFRDHMSVAIGALTIEEGKSFKRVFTLHPRLGEKHSFRLTFRMSRENDT